MIFYGNPSVNTGTNALHSLGDGYTINVSWYQAYTNIVGYKIAYNIYYSIHKDQVFAEGIKFVSIDGSLNTNITDLAPGQEYLFAIRPVEYDPNIFNLTLLPIAYNNLRVYPTSLLRQDIVPTDIVIPLLDVSDFPSTGIVQVGIELIQYLAVDQVNNNLLVSGGVAPIPAHFVVQQGGNFYIPGTNNVGTGTINNLSIFPGITALSETWSIRCIGAQTDSMGNTIPTTAKFETIGSISGVQRDQYTNTILWEANGINVTGSVLSFSITETTTFAIGDSFTVQVVGLTPGISGGRGYNGTPISLHDTDGYDGVNYWNPTVELFTLGESTLWDRIYVCQCRFEYPNFAFTMVDGYKQVTQDILSTDLAAADAANVTFPEYDYAGWHRTDPVQLMNGTCVGSYIGGEMGCIDGYGNYNIYRGFSLQDQNTQRQDVLLSIDGRVAVLIRRVQQGIPCSCYLSSSEYPDDRCPLCFVAGTLVRTEMGFRHIEQIKIGEKVLSADGLYHSVLRVFERQYEGKLHAITSTVSTNPILVTPEHPFMVMRGSHQLDNNCGPNSNCKSFINRGGGFGKSTPQQLPSGKYWARTQLKEGSRISLGSFDTLEDAEQAIFQYKKDKVVPGHMLDWDDAKNIKSNDWLVAKWSDKVSDVYVINIPQEYRKNTKLGSKRLGPDQFIVDEEFLWMIGMYIAEGSHSKRSINFALHIKETNFSDRLVAYFIKQGYHPVVRKSSENGMIVEINSTTLANWFPKWLGALCDNKHIPEEFMKLPSHKALAIIGGIYDGDGTKRENEIIQTSEILALQLSELLHRIGKQPLVSQVENNTLTINGNKRKKVYRVNWEESTLINHNRKGRWDYNGHLLAKVRDVNETQYSGMVYNLEVEGDHTYVVQGIVAHNCYGTKFVFGYEQYHNPRSSDGRIMVRVSPTAENLKMHEAGLESEFPLDMWTLTVPTIKTRDVIVLFDQDDNEEFRYEVGDVTRNNTIIGLDGGQHFKTWRVRKFDPIYQIRIIRNSADFPQQLSTSIGFTPGIPPHTHNIVINENIVSVSQINQTTDVQQGHNHPIVSGEIIEVLGHTHQIILL